MIRNEHVPLSTLTTLRVGGPARVVIPISTYQDIPEAIAYIQEQHLPFYVLGEGSNVLPHDTGYEGAILLMRIPGITYEDRGEQVLVRAGAGVLWDMLVEEVARQGLWGFENLAGIPGTVGATPVQNIGAYGADIAQTLHSVEVYDTITHTPQTLNVSQCELGYRDSRFKHEPNLIITACTFALSKNGTPHITYGDLLRAQESGSEMNTPEAIGKTVRSIREGKFPDRRIHGTAGSFFKNPVISAQTYAELQQKYGSIPQFPHPHGIKIPLAFILDKVLGLRGFRLNHAWLFGTQPLVLVLDAGGTAQEVEALANVVEEKVFSETGIRIEREVRSLEQK